MANIIMSRGDRTLPAEREERRRMHDATAPNVTAELTRPMDWAAVREAIERCGIKATGNLVYAVPMTYDQVNTIIVPQGTADTSSDGVVIAAGPLAFVHVGEPDPKLDCRSDDDYKEIERLSRYRIKAGDIIHSARWGGVEAPRWWINKLLDKLLVMTADDVLGVIEVGGAFRADRT